MMGPDRRLDPREAGYITAVQAGGPTRWAEVGKGIRCGTCVHFLGGGRIAGAGYAVNAVLAEGCRLVRGTIDSQGCCNLWNIGTPGLPLISEVGSLAVGVAEKLHALGVR